MKKISKAGNIMVKGFVIFTMAFLLLVYFLLILHGLLHYEDARYLYSFEQKGWLFILCGLSLLFFLLLYFMAGEFFKRCSDRVLKGIWILFCLGALLIQGYFLFYVRSYYKFDTGYVLGIAASLADHGRVNEELLYYISVYPNQNTFVFLTSMLIKLCDLLGISGVNRPLLFNVFNTICLDSAMLLTFPILKKCGVNLPLWKKTRILFLMLCNPFLYLGVSYYYTITLSLPFTQGFLYFALSALNEKQDQKSRIRGGILGGILLGIGYEMRATTIIFAIAFAMVFMWKLIKSGNKKLKQNLIFICILGIVFCITAGGLSEVQKAYIGIDTTDTAFPTTHWLMMSLTMPGEYNMEDEIFTASFPTKEEKKAAVIERMKEKLDAMSPGDYLALAKAKLTRTFGDGINGYPIFLGDVLHIDRMYEWVFGSRKDMMILWHQGYYLFILFGVFVGSAGFLKQFFSHGTAGNIRRSISFFLLCLILVGALLFYILWEAGQQYSIPFIIVMWMAALMGYDTLEKQPLAKEKQAKILSIAAFCAAAFIALWGIFRYEKMTKEPVITFRPVAVQTLAHGSYAVGDGVKLIQEIQAEEPFNRLVIQWRNPAQKENSSVYHVSLVEQAGGRIVFETDIVAADSGYNGMGTYNFDEAAPGSGTYHLVIEKTAGRPEHNLNFACFNMYGYQAYPLGGLYVEEGGQRTRIETSMLFAIYMGDASGYATRKTYVIFLSILFLSFLFTGFWCKLKVVSFT